MKKFKHLRPPGHGIDSRRLHRALPVAVRRKISRRAVIRRLADKGFTPKTKSRKSDPEVALAKHGSTLLAFTSIRQGPTGHRISSRSGT